MRSRTFFSSSHRSKKSCATIVYLLASTCIMTGLVVWMSHHWQHFQSQVYQQYASSFQASDPSWNCSKLLQPADAKIYVLESSSSTKTDVSAVNLRRMVMIKQAQSLGFAPYRRMPFEYSNLVDHRAQPPVGDNAQMVFAHLNAWDHVARELSEW